MTDNWCIHIVIHIVEAIMHETPAPPCIVEGVQHAFVPQRQDQRTDPHAALGYQRATCGRCQLVRVTHPSGFQSFWKPCKLQPQD